VAERVHKRKEQGACLALDLRDLPIIIQTLEAQLTKVLPRLGPRVLVSRHLLSSPTIADQNRMSLPFAADAEKIGAMPDFDAIG
jgi:hypothetical protein